jgi:hypothetical protein
MTLLILTAVMVLGTGVLGWWAVPVLGLVYGAWRGAGRAAAVAGLSALLGWSALLAWNWFEGPVAELAASLGTVIGLPARALLLATVLFPAVLAWTAAVVGAAIRRS